LTIRIDFSNWVSISTLEIDSNRIRISILILEIDLSRLLSRIDSNRQDSSQLIDSNSINRLNAISLVSIDIVSNNTNLLLFFVKNVLDVFISKLLATRLYIWVTINVKNSSSLFNKKNISATTQIISKFKLFFLSIVCC